MNDDRQASQRLHNTVFELSLVCFQHFQLFLLQILVLHSLAEMEQHVFQMGTPMVASVLQTLLGQTVVSVVTVHIHKAICYLDLKKNQFVTRYILQLQMHYIFRNTNWCCWTRTSRTTRTCRTCRSPGSAGNTRKGRTARAPRTTRCPWWRSEPYTRTPRTSRTTRSYFNIIYLVLLNDYFIASMYTTS